MPCAPSTYFSITMCTCVTLDSQGKGEEEDLPQVIEEETTSVDVSSEGDFYLFI